MCLCCQDKRKKIHGLKSCEPEFLVTCVDDEMNEFQDEDPIVFFEAQKMA